MFAALWLKLSKAGREPTPVTKFSIGMALTAIVFAILNAAVIRPLPVKAPDDLVVILERRGEGEA